MNRSPIFAIAGATGAVGKELLTILSHRGVDPSSLRLFASSRSAGSELEYAGVRLPVGRLDPSSFGGVDVALFSAGATIARELAPAATKAGAIVIDNSSAFRMEPEVPLIVPEVNGDVLRRDALRGEIPPIIANPNCSTIILVTALHPLLRAFGIDRLVVSTYQAASGAGEAAMRELAGQSAEVLAGNAASPEVFAEPCAFNVFSHDTDVDGGSGRNVEEQKVIDETRKIFGEPALAMSVTCIRVPVMRAHAESVNVRLAGPATEMAVRDALDGAPGIAVVDDREANDFPTSLKASGRDDILVGRIRPDPSQGHDEGAGVGFDLFIAGDQLRKGAALNALQIADIVGTRA